VAGGMSFELTEDQELIRKSVAELAGKFDDHYWMEKDQAHEFPQEFYDAIAKGGWLGMTIPETTTGWRRTKRTNSPRSSTTPSPRAAGLA